MSPKWKTLIWIIPLCVIASMLIILPSVWILSRLLQFTFDLKTTTIVGMLSAASSGTIVSAIILTGVTRKQK